MLQWTQTQQREACNKSYNDPPIYLLVSLRSQRPGPSELQDTRSVFAATVFFAHANNTILGSRGQNSMGPELLG